MEHDDDQTANVPEMTNMLKMLVTYCDLTKRDELKQRIFNREIEIADPIRVTAIRNYKTFLGGKPCVYTMEPSSPGGTMVHLKNAKHELKPSHLPVKWDTESVLCLCKCRQAMEVIPLLKDGVIMYYLQRHELYTSEMNFKKADAGDEGCPVHMTGRYSNWRID